MAHGHEAAVSIDKMLNGEDITNRPLPAVELPQKMGIHEWSYDNEIELDKRYKVPLRDNAHCAEKTSRPKSSWASTSRLR